MKRIATSLVVMASLAGAGLAGAGYAFAQDTEPTNAVETSERDQRSGKRFKRGPINLEQFSRMERLNAADTNGDGTLDREELEAHALNQMIKRMADRMERRLDIDGDGVVTLAEIEAQRGKEFSALDRNNDGELDRRELRASKMDRSFGKRSHHNGRHSMHRHHR